MSFITYLYFDNKLSSGNSDVKQEAIPVITEEPQDKASEESAQVITKDIVISAVGDCTLGTDSNFGYTNSFTNVLDDNNRDFSYFFSGVYDILSQDDLTIANLETTFTTATVRKEKRFNFKGDYDYTNILKEGSVEAVNLANNHTYDYLEQGYNDTIEALKDANINYFGYENYSVVEAQGIKIGLAGITGWSETEAKKNTSAAIQYFRENDVDLIIISYHWGIEYEYEQNSIQKRIGEYAIDEGADLVLGHHPHVLQGIEEYNGKYIVYSLGNFVFGGNKNPSDKDTMIFQQTFHFEDGYLISSSINIIPCSLSGKSEINDYKPKILEGDEKSRVLEKIMANSLLSDF
jgi:poly-gamma-glutamate synthesis protein (capsule biosynthesis protein)